MTQITRYDPYRNFKFIVKFDTKAVAGISKVGILKRATQVISHRRGGDPSTDIKCPGQTKYDAITLEQGITDDTEFEVWANKVWNYSAPVGNESSLIDFRKDITIELLDEAGKSAVVYRVHNCWVSEYQALPELDAIGGNAIAIQHIKLENEGWERVEVVK